MICSTFEEREWEQKSYFVVKIALRGDKCKITWFCGIIIEIILEGKGNKKFLKIIKMLKKNLLGSESENTTKLMWESCMKTTEKDIMKFHILIKLSNHHKWTRDSFEITTWEINMKKICCRRSDGLSRVWFGVTINELFDKLSRLSCLLTKNWIEEITLMIMGGS